VKIRDDMSICTRIAAIETALEIVLNRGSQMEVGPAEDPGTLYVWVIERPHSDSRVAFSLHQIARELEVLLS